MIRRWLASLRGAAEVKPRSHGHPLPDYTASCTCPAPTPATLHPASHRSRTARHAAAPSVPTAAAAVTTSGATDDRKARAPIPGWDMGTRPPIGGSNGNTRFYAQRATPSSMAVIAASHATATGCLHKLESSPSRSHHNTPPPPPNTERPPPPIFPPWPSPHGSSPPPHGVPPTNRTYRPPSGTLRPSMPPRPTPPPTPTGPSL